MTFRTASAPRSLRLTTTLWACACFTLFACSGDNSSGRARPAATDPNLAADASLPGLVIQITGVSGGTGSGGNFAVGDRLSVTFTIKKGDGTELSLDDLNFSGIMVSGPTSHYQRVIASQSDLVTASHYNGDGSYTYQFASAIPSSYLAPLNDTTAFGVADGEMTGQALEAGTYTVGIEGYKNYVIEDVTYRDSANATKDFLLGNATTLAPHDVVTTANCNLCHSELRAHGGIRKQVALCVLCHTAGAEDRNVAAVESGTPGVSIDFKVMVHKIHNGAHLPSVLGVATNSDGSRNYAATAQPYRMVGFQNRVIDFSDIHFPVWPNLNLPTLRDFGYTALTSGQKTTEDTIRMGVTACAKCHGDPDGAGALPAPAQGDRAYTAPGRAACGSCHDDIDWSKRYTANQQTMDPQTDDRDCLSCHPASGGQLSQRDAHVHPLLDPTYNPGLNFNVTSVSESGSHNGNGRIDAGEKVQIEFTMRDDRGVDVSTSAIASVSVVLSGPTTNSNLLLNTSIPTAVLTGSQPFSTRLPEPIVFELVGTATGSLGDQFTTARAPHWAGTTTTVRVRTATSGGSSTLAAAATAPRNVVTVNSVTSFARNDFVVIDDGTANVEYLQIALVDGAKLWFTSPLRKDHAASAAIQEVTLTTKSATGGTPDYSLNATTGVITELVEFGNGNAVVVSYTSDFVMPATYPAAINDSPDLGDASGKWSGKALVSGTYTVGLWAARTITVTLYNETNSLRGTSPPAVRSFLVGSATTLESRSVVSSGDNCNSCHDDLWFHGGGRRGWETCVLCHGTAGAEDRTRYTAASAPETTGVKIDFREMLHKIHMGAELTNASTYTVVGFGASAYPNNYGSSTYGEVEFPVMPDGPRGCAKCHGTGSDTWKAPQERAHPTQQTTAIGRWSVPCGSCHDSDAAQAHIAVQTGSDGTESCGICHGSGKLWSVELKHKAR